MKVGLAILFFAAPSGKGGDPILHWALGGRVPTSAAEC